MTFIERLEREHPEFIGPQYLGGVALCPADAGYEETSPCPIAHGGLPDNPAACYGCWHRTIPGTEADG